jgi:hypothetical protein
VPHPSRSLSPWLLALLALLPALPASAQVFVFPRQAGKSQVRNFDFDWNHIDLAFPVGPGADAGFSMVTGRPIVIGDAPPAAADGGTPGPTDGGVLAEGAADGGGADGGAAEALTYGANLDGGAPPDGGAMAVGSLPDGGTTAPLRQPYVRPVPSGTGQVRLFFYERERQIAERATTLIQNSYERLVESFRYVPAQTFPYILYSSYQEFLQTNLSPVQEGTLGFTSPQDLTLSLPYFGDDRLFELVSTHELAHQFTIQKVRTVAGASGITGEPLARIPLWFIEGLAEYTAQGGMDPEAEMLVRDLVINQDPARGFVLGDFFQQGPGSFLWIYKMGQARCAFLDETYGLGFVHRVLDESWRLVGRGPMGGGDFVQLLERLTGEKQAVISSRFERWLKLRAFRNYLGSEQDVPDLVPLQGGPEFTDSMTSSPDGRLLMIRAIEPLTGQSRLVLLDPQAPQQQFTVVSDGQPGVESLGLVFGRNYDLGNGRAVFLASASSRDVLFVQDLRYSAEERDPPPDRGGPMGGPMGGPPAGGPGGGLGGPGRERLRDVDVRFGQRREFLLEKEGIIAAFSPSLSPDEKQVAFIGLLTEGIRDIFVLDVESGAVRRVTTSPTTERQVHWGRSGILYTSDATEKRRFNLFRVSPQPGATPTRLTFEERDHQDPQEMTDGRIFFTAYTPDGRADLHEALPDRIVRRTDIATGLFDPTPTPEGGAWAMLHRNGRRQPVRLAPSSLGQREVVQMGTPGEVPVLAVRSLGDAEPYRPFQAQNLELGPIFGFGGVGGGGIFGQLMASATDKMRNHGAVLQVAAFGSWELTNGVLYYLNNESRVTWGGGLFQTLRFRRDVGTASFPFASYERFFGVSGLARFPFSAFAFAEGEVSLGGAAYFMDQFQREVLGNPALRAELNAQRGLPPDADGDVYGRWRDTVGGARPQGELALRLGYDTLRYDAFAGPIDGTTLLLENILDYQPTTGQVFGNLRLDAERYVPLFARIHLMGRLGAGTAYGGYFARDYFLSSYDTIRGAPFGDERYLTGRNYLYSTAEVQVPLNQIIAVAFLSDVEGIAGVDFGGTGATPLDVWNGRILNFVAGVNLGLGPLLIRVHFARPFNIGAPRGLPVANEGDWVPNFSIGMAGMPGFIGRESGAGRSQARPAIGPMAPRTLF